MMTGFQFQNVRHMLGLSQTEMGAALGIKKHSVIYLETGNSFFARHEKATSFGQHELNHVFAFACGWMLFNGRPFVPWPREEDAHHMRLFRNYHKLTNEEFAALMSLSKKEVVLWFMGARGIPNRHMMAVCWMRVFGTRNPFAFMQTSDPPPNTLPMILDSQYERVNLRGRGRIVEADSIRGE